MIRPARVAVRFAVAFIGIWLATVATSAVMPGMAVEAAAAQVVPRDTVPADTVPRDTLRRDTVPRQPVTDTVPGDTLTRDRLPGDTIHSDTLARDTVPGDTIPGDTLADERAVPAAVDSVLTQLRALEGYVATEYAGDSAVYTAADGVLRLRGDAEVSREGNVLTAADSIVYRESAQLVEAHGTPRVRGQDQDLEGDVLFYDLARERATALAARTQISEGATWYVDGDVTIEQTARIYARRGRFTTDDRPEPQYHFRADRIKVVRDRVLVAAPARLFFGKVPVFWLPFIVQDLERGRRSGILTPEFGINDIVRNSSGHTREISNVGVYWAINDYLGAQLAGTWRSATYTALRGSLDWNWRRQFLRGGLNFQQYWQQQGSTQRTLSGNASWRPNERTDLSGSANYASSSQFIQETTTDPLRATQDLSSTLKINRRFDWGQVSLGSSRRQRISDGSVTATLPSFSINPRTFTLFRQPSPERARWYNNAAVQVGIRGERGFRSGLTDFDRMLQDEETLDLSGGLQQLSIGNLTLSATGTLDQRLLEGATGVGSADTVVVLEREHRDVARWDARISYRQSLIGQTSISPNLSLSQEVRRDSITGSEYIGAPVRMTFGAGTTAALYGFFPGIGPYSAIRHRLSPTLSYGYSPQVVQTELQKDVFGEAGGRTRNTISLRLNQTWEAKLRPREVAEEQRREEADSAALAALDSVQGGEAEDERATPSAPADPEKVTILSVNTSALEYDFAQAAAEGNGFTTQRVSNSISSDFLRGTTVRVEHELFDRSDLDPNDPETRGELGRFAPRLSSLSTSFTLGPSSAVVRWIQGLFGAEGTAVDRAQAAGEAGAEAGDERRLPGARPGEEVNPEGAGPATNNPRSAGGGPWRVGLDYRYSRRSRDFSRSTIREDEPVQTVGAEMSFALTPNWALNWRTDYSITDREFGTHHLVLRRDLYRWEADFSYTLQPYGGSSFNMRVRLKDLPDLKFDYREPNLGIDRNRGGTTGG